MKYYFHDLLTKIKTATDILALMINHIFELGIEDEKCALHHGKICGALRNHPDYDQSREELARKLDRERNNWIKLFYELRNVAIHKTVIPLVGKASDSFNRSRFNIQTALITADHREAFDKLLEKINSQSISPVDGGIDIVRFTSEVWKLLTFSVEEIIKACEPQIYKFIQKQMQ